MNLTPEKLSLIRAVAQRLPQCCAPDREPCDKCLVLRAVDDLVLEVERHRADLPPPAIRIAPSEEHSALVLHARALIDALGTLVPLPPAAHVARSRVAELLEEIEARG